MSPNRDSGIMSGRTAHLLIIYVALVVTIGAVVFIAKRSEDLSNTGKRIDAAQVFNCQQIEGLKAGTRQQLLRNLKGLPENAYYKEHPDELEDAITGIRGYLKIYAPRECTPVG